MAINSSNLIYAIKDDKIVHVSDVESGLKCNCICPACGEKLIARKGQKVMHHFAHQSKGNCEYGYQTSLHLAAKDILSKSKRMIIPEVVLDFSNHNGIYKKVKISDAIEIKLDKVELEKAQGDVIPDVIAYSGSKKFYIEIYVTHPIDDIKLNKLKEGNISTIEINLSKMDRNISKEMLEEILVGDSSEKKWAYNVKENKWFNRFIRSSEKMHVTQRGLASHVDNCPIAVRWWRGKPYANLIDDCFYCEYCVEVSNDYENDNNYIRCTGKYRLAEVSDFDTPLKERIEKSNAQYEAERMKDIADGYCPNCGRKLVLKNGKFGRFYGCSNYPHCRFTANINEQMGELIIDS